MLTYIARLLKRIVVMVLFAIVLLQPIIVEPPEAVGGEFEGATLTVEEGWVVLTLAGTPYQMGLQQGVLLAPYLRELIATKLYPLLEEAGVSRGDAERYGHFVAPDLPQSLWEEMRGIANGSGVPLQDLWLWNLRFDLLALGQDLPFMVREEPWEGRIWQLDEVSTKVIPDQRLPWPRLGLEEEARAFEEAEQSISLAVWDDATFDHEPWLAAILAAPAGEERFLLVRRDGEGEVPFMGLALPGEVGVRAGINQAAVAFMMTPFATADRSLEGIPPFMLLRYLLAQSKSSQQAKELLLQAKTIGGASILMADSIQKEPLQIQASARQVRLHENSEGILLAAGAPLEGSLAPSAALLRAPTEKNKAQRERLGAWLRLNKGFITEKKLQRLLAEADIHAQDSGAMLMWQPGSSQFWLAQAAQAQPAPASGWFFFDID